MSMAETVLEGIRPEFVWDLLRDPGFAVLLLPDIVEATVVSGSGVGERVRYVCREGTTDTVTLAEVTALTPGRLIELTPVGDATLLTVRSWAEVGLTWFGVGRTLQADDDEYVRRAAHVVPILLESDAGLRRTR